MKQQSTLYFVAFVLPEPVLSEIEQLKLTIAQRFGSSTCLKAPAHITLLPPFRYPDDVALIERLHHFEYKEKILIHLKGYGWFGKKVLFIKPEPEEQLRAVGQAVQQHFRQMLRLNTDKHLQSFVPHVTIGNRDWTVAQFEQARLYFTQQYPFEARCELERVSLLRWKSGRWSIIANTR